jgi:hypothetical protein
VLGHRNLRTRQPRLHLVTPGHPLLPASRQLQHEAARQLCVDDAHPCQLACNTSPGPTCTPSTSVIMLPNVCPSIGPARATSRRKVCHMCTCIVHVLLGTLTRVLIEQVAQKHYILEMQFCIFSAWSVLIRRCWLCSLIADSSKQQLVQALGDCMAHWQAGRLTGGAAGGTWLGPEPRPRLPRHQCQEGSCNASACATSSCCAASPQPPPAQQCCCC